jgi:RimJ/RimL family protein N-acetyltransferase
VRIRLVWNDSVGVAAWVMQQFKRVPAKPFRAVGVIDDAGKLIGGIVINGYNGANCDLTIFGGACFTRRAMREFFTFVFSPAPAGLQCTRVTARTPKTNKKMARLLPRLGFSCEGLQRLYYGERRGPTGTPLLSNHAVIYGMLAADCPWIRKSNSGRTRGAFAGKNRSRPIANESRNGSHAS